MAGTFYPGDAQALRRAVADCVSAAPLPPDLHDTEAVIAAHAGYRYSGATAAAAYRAVAARRHGCAGSWSWAPRTATRWAAPASAISTADAWDTPLGEVATRHRGGRPAGGRPAWPSRPTPPTPPSTASRCSCRSCRRLLGDVPVLPLVVGRAAAPGRRRRVRGRVGGPGDADGGLLRPQPLPGRRHRPRPRRAHGDGHPRGAGPTTSGRYDACGCMPIRGLLLAAARRGLAPRLLGMTTSAPTSGDAERVVGYGAFAFGPPAPLDDTDRHWLVALARRAIEYELATGEPYPLDDAEVPERVRAPGAAFVTLERGDELLGCIGSLEPRRPLWHDVARNARAAAFDDPRFAPLTAAELAGAQVEVSVLSHAGGDPRRRRRGGRGVGAPGCRRRGAGGAAIGARSCRRCGPSCPSPTSSSATWWRRRACRRGPPAPGPGATPSTSSPTPPARPRLRRRSRRAPQAPRARHRPSRRPPTRRPPPPAGPGVVGLAGGGADDPVDRTNALGTL